MEMFKQSQEGIEQYMKHDDWYFWVSMNQGSVSMPVFQSLEAFWPGVLSLVGKEIAHIYFVFDFFVGLILLVDRPRDHPELSIENRH